jgi:nucleoside-diphosphate-sugar epimerase
LSGPLTRLGDAVEIAARIGGHRPPSLRLPTGLLRVTAPLGRLVGQANLAEVVTSSAGVTYWATHDRATRELGFAPREIEQGLRDTFGAA